MFDKTYLEDDNLIIETIFLKEKIAVDSIDDIVIISEFPSRKYALHMFFTKPIKYQPNKGWINRVISYIYLQNNNPYMIKRTYYDNEIEPLLLMIKKCLPEADYPDLKNSLYWRTNDGKNAFSKVKIIYSREKLSLANILTKHGMMKG